MIALKIGEALLLSPVFCFVLASLPLLVMKAVVRAPALYKGPRAAPPPRIRGLLILIVIWAYSRRHSRRRGVRGW